MKFKKAPGQMKNGVPRGADKSNLLQDSDIESSDQPDEQSQPGSYKKAFKAGQGQLKFRGKRSDMSESEQASAQDMDEQVMADMRVSRFYRSKHYTLHSTKKR